MRRAVVSLVAASLGLGACGLVSGLDGLGVSDATVDAPSDAGTIDVASPCEAGACGAPAGFAPIWLATDRNGACAGAQDIVMDPTPPGTASCKCSCTPTPSCVPQPYITVYEGSNCGTFGSLDVVVDGGCNAFDAAVPADLRIPAFAPADASCSGSVSGGGALPSILGRLCSVSDCSACAAPAGFQLCYYAAGQATCPDGMKSHVVGTAAQADCAACSACTTHGSCGGTFTLYTSSSCTGGSTVVTVGGVCHGGAGTYTSTRYVPTFDGGCTPGASTATLDVTSEGTVCCP